MKRKKEKLALIGILFILAFANLNYKQASPAVETVREYVLNEIHETVLILEQFKNDTTHQKALYLKARRHYKHTEFFVEYYSPREAKYDINGPLVPKHDIENGRTVIEPKGFQPIEELLFSDKPVNQQELNGLVNELMVSLKKLRSYYSGAEITESMLLEMPQLQFHRLASLTLNGYDATLCQNNVEEAAWSLEGIGVVLEAFRKNLCEKAGTRKNWQQARKKLNEALAFLQKNPDYISFDRLTFITSHLEPLNSSWIDLHENSGINWQTKKQALKLRNKGLFKKGIWNLPFFNIYYADTLNTNLQAELGKLLFFDPILSGNGQRSCAGCHRTDQAFAEPLATSGHFDGINRLERNAPSLFNVGLQQAFFHDGRAGQLEQQAFDVVHNKDEMAGDLQKTALKLAESDEYVQLFAKAFPNEKKPGINVYQIQKVLVEYQRSLISLNSRFDQYLNGNTSALNQREKNGYNLFAGKALCGSCHFFPLFNGTVPPFYTDSEFEVIGTPTTKISKELSKDPGRYKVTQLDMHHSSFKTPTVRNVELTAPYMHNGVFDKLEEVVEFYHKGGGKGMGIAVKNQTLPFDSLKLTTTEKEDLVLFLKSLTDISGNYSAPQNLPKFNQAILDKRKVGGVY